MNTVDSQPWHASQVQPISKTGQGLEEPKATASPCRPTGGRPRGSRRE
jgi:hypothetical protein